MFNHNRMTKLLGITYPIIQGGMVWVSGGKLAAAVSNAGGLGLIGAGSMNFDLLKDQILKANTLTTKPFGVNIPLLYKHSQEQIDLSLSLGIKIFFTSAGSPKKYTQYLKDKGCTVVHVTSSPELAIKCEQAGVDAIVAEGFEAGGHNGREEITTMALIPQVVDAVRIPVIAAGGIGDGRTMTAAFALGAEAVQMGTRFVLTKESSAHDNFKKAIIDARSDGTMLSLKKIVPVRLLKNKFFEEITQLENEGASTAELLEFLGKGRAKAGMLLGDLDQGELEIGQISGLLKDCPSSLEVITEIINSYQKTILKLNQNS